MTEMPAIPKFLDRTPLIGTYSFMHNYVDICQYQTFHRYIAKTIKFVETPEIKFGNEVHKAFERRIGGGVPLPVNMQQWEPFARPFDGQGAKVETQLGLTADGRATRYFGDDVRYRVKIDVNVIKGTTAYIADFKTGGSKYEDPFELEVGALHLHALHPTLTKIVGNFIWLKENRLGQTYDLSDTKATWNKVTGIMKSMETARANDDWPKRPSGLCGWCPVKDCEHWRERK